MQQQSKSQNHQKKPKTKQEQKNKNKPKNQNRNQKTNQKTPPKQNPPKLKKPKKPKNPQTKNQNQEHRKRNQKPPKKPKKPKNKKLRCRDLGHLYSLYAYIILGYRVLSGEGNMCPVGRQRGAEILKSGGGMSVIWQCGLESVLSRGECLLCTYIKMPEISTS